MIGRYHLSARPVPNLRTMDNRNNELLRWLSESCGVASGVVGQPAALRSQGVVNPYSKDYGRTMSGYDALARDGDEGSGSAEKDVARVPVTLE